MKEITVYGCGRYYISNYGKVYSLCNSEWKEKAQQLDKDGYYYVDLYEDGERIRYRTHKLVAMYFLEKIESKPIVHHKNFIKRDNNYLNLMYVDEEEHAKLHSKEGQ